jgi:hypothetical protein
MLFGSRAQRKAHGDYGLAAFIKDPGKLWDKVESSRA